MNNWKELSYLAERETKLECKSLEHALIAVAGLWCDAMTTTDEKRFMRNLVYCFAYLHRAQRMADKSIDDLKIGTPPRKAMRVFEDIEFCFDLNVNREQMHLGNEVRELMEKNGLPYKPNEVIGITEIVEDYFSKPVVPKKPQSTWPGLGELCRKIKSKNPNATRKAIAEEYGKSQKRLPTEDEIETWKVWIKNHGSKYWKPTDKLK